MAIQQSQVRQGQTTVSQVFATRHLWQWWTQNNGYGTNPYNGITEKGIDYASTFGIPIGVPVGGKIIRKVYNANSIRWVVELQDSSGAVWLYQHIDSSVSVGQTLQCGSIIGTENGLPVDQYSTGPHIEVRYCPPGAWSPNIISWDEPWVNPYNVFINIGNQVAGSSPGGGGPPPGGPPGGAPGGVPQNVVNHLAPNADVSAFLVVLDQLLTIGNPFVVTGASTDTFGAWPAQLTITDPFSWLQGFGTNIINDLVAFVLRCILLATGVFIIYKILSNFIDMSGAQQAGSDVLGKILPLIMAA